MTATTTQDVSKALPKTRVMRGLLLGTAMLALAACDEMKTWDLDLRGVTGNRADTSNAARQATSARPAPDDRGIISYPGYQVAVAQRGDTLQAVADRIGFSGDELARFNGIKTSDTLRAGEIVALPRRVAEPSPATGAATTGPIQPPSSVDVTALAGSAIDSAESTAGSAAKLPQTGVEPIRHRVERGETAFSVARLYGVNVRALAEWNGLGSDLDVREGQFLLIPVAAPDAPAATAAAVVPGAGTPTPTPPSASAPLPAETPPAANVAVATPPAPDLGAATKPATTSKARMLYPVSGNIIRDYKKGVNDGINIGAAAGTPVKAADAGTVAAITRDTDQVPILVLRHSGGLLTVYANVDDLKVKKGDKVARGEVIAAVRASDPSFLHFEVRRGLDSTDPTPFLN
ncbi:peptidoglycan DD-metalloendopeptidase family protein [Nereida sp. MMG025]|uniref:peptidoglycan DD-metalloendopeptidase family protein n=1 Tax=Nereida sp. MMG025 TaxID=2909981 RepID=UPI001F40274F|nr:peptidoglycan DD-metalloendopeptidase family protein [Nereida sp. MMG025]MCF6445329.1 peptidoglycan DD-metalloendopeptidase family protein [Nereida sp. MMG025]